MRIAVHLMHQVSFFITERGGSIMGLTALIESGMEATAATELLLNVVWTIVGAILVYFMQAGFAMCEAGFTRAKNTGNILMKNMMDFVLGSLFFFIFGFAIMHGSDWNGIIGSTGFLDPTKLADADGLFNGLPIGVFIIFHTVFCATAATLAALIVTWIRYGKPDVSMTFNGSLAGLVAITAGCDCVSNVSAILRIVFTLCSSTRSSNE